MYYILYYIYTSSNYWHFERNYYWPKMHLLKMWQKFGQGPPPSLDALESLDFKLSVAQSVIFFTASASTGLSDLFFGKPFHSIVYHLVSVLCFMILYSPLFFIFIFTEIKSNKWMKITMPEIKVIGFVEMSKFLWWMS